MRKLAVFGALFAALALPVAATASGDDDHGDGNGHRFGPYSGTSLDSGTCGNFWAETSFQRVFKVRPQNADGTYTVREDFVHGSFVTTVGSSPGGCDTNLGGTILPGVEGRMRGHVILTVTGTFDPDATCAAPCATGEFVAAFFGPTATYEVPEFLFTYRSHDQRLCAHFWRNASPQIGGTAGDIATTCTIGDHHDEHEGG
jgi:hypothetical protein